MSRARLCRLRARLQHRRELPRPNRRVRAERRFAGERARHVHPMIRACVLAPLPALLARAPRGARRAQPARGAAPSPAPAPPRAAGRRPSPLNFSGVIFGNFNYQIPTTPNQLRESVEQRVHARPRVPDLSHAGRRAHEHPHHHRRLSDDGDDAERVHRSREVRVPPVRRARSCERRASMLARRHHAERRDRYIENVLAALSEPDTPVERAGYFASADVGLAARIQLPEQDGRGVRNAS